MTMVVVVEQDILDVYAGQSKFIPLPSGGVAILEYRSGAVRLRIIPAAVIMTKDATAGEGAATETPPVGSE